MERQTILERLGWRFIRIRGSEYYRDTERTIERVVSELEAYGIEPELANTIKPEGRTTELLNRVKHRAAVILYGEETPYFDPKVGQDIINELQEIQRVNIGPDLESLIPNDKNQEKEGLVRKTSEKEEQRIYESPKDIPQEKNPVKKVIPESKKDEKKVTSLHQAEIKWKPAAKDQKRASSEIANRSGRSKTKKAEEIYEQLSFYDVIKSTTPGDGVFSLLRKNGIKYIDKRKSGGALWILGGQELESVVKEAAKLGVKFRFKGGGGRATDGRDGWWAKF